MKNSSELVEFKTPPKELRVMFENGSHIVHAGVVANATGEKVLVALSRHRQAQEGTFSPTSVDFIAHTVRGNDAVQRAIAQSSEDGIPVRGPFTESELADLLRSLREGMA